MTDLLRVEEKVVLNVSSRYLLILGGRWHSILGIVTQFSMHIVEFTSGIGSDPRGDATQIRQRSISLIFLRFFSIFLCACPGYFLSGRNPGK